MFSTRTEFDAIGTHWSIDLFDKIDGESAEKLFLKLRKEIESFDKTYSRFRADSLFSEISHNPGTYHLPKSAEKIFRLYKLLYDVSEGKFTPLIGTLLSEMGYDREYSLLPKSLSTVPNWSDVLSIKGSTLKTSSPLEIDIGAAGKGYLVDIVSECIEEANISAYCVDAGGDIRVRNVGNTSLQIGLENPNDAGQVIGVANLKNKSICGSAGNRRKWGDFTHIVNPITRTSPKEISATWVIAADTLTADALATCLFFVAPSKLLSTFKFDYVIVGADGSVRNSPTFPGELFTKVKK